MFGATKLGKLQSSTYANTTDFCRIFETDMNRLYRLSFLLTGDEPVAEQCFLGGLQMAQEGTPVFKNWAEAWARRMIILDAIRVLHSQLVDTSESFGRVVGDCATNRIEIAEIVKFPVFERFTFVMSVLQGYSDHECSLHLACTRAAVAAARVRALERIGRAAKLRGKLVSIAAAQEQQGNRFQVCGQIAALTITPAHWMGRSATIDLLIGERMPYRPSVENLANGLTSLARTEFRFRGIWPPMATHSSEFWAKSCRLSLRSLRCRIRQSFVLYSTPVRTSSSTNQDFARAFGEIWLGLSLSSMNELFSAPGF